ncbi:MAG: nucleotidyltransferase domain-containing protein [ANME-2 cluster archaeon]|jgi:predicted nucleotidyltransferase|nr:nucleotidyltransferase domain-containing protein [ANME-2 cluster archaeon]
MNQKQEIFDKLKSTLNDLKIGYSRILMFGSRARGDFNEDSDWDFFIILKKPLDARTKKELWFDIYKKLHEFYPFISFDIVLKDAESFEEEKTIVNTISNEVYLEGIEA